MKKILLIVSMLCLAIPGVFAQSGTTSFDVDGIKVIFKPTVKEIINVRLFFRGGVSNYTPAQAGIESFALEAATQCGTQKYNGNAFKTMADTYSIDIGSGSNFDSGNVDMECISKYFDQAWDLFSEAIVNPTFDNNEVELLRNKIISRVRQEQSDPDKRVEQLMLQNAFAGTPYATSPDGSEETLSRFTADDLKAYYKTILNKNQIFIVVAGKINKDELIAKIHASFASLPSRLYTAPVYKEPIWDDYKVRAEERSLSTNYISAIMNAPQVTSPDYVPFRLGISILGGALFNDLRTKLNLSYDPGANSEMRQMPYATMYVSTTQPKQAVLELTRMLNLVRAYGASKDGLKHLKSGYIVTNYLKQQSTAAITGSLGEAEILGGWEMDEKLPEAINSVTVDQIDIALNEYIVGLRWAYLGNVAQGEEANDAFGVKVNTFVSGRKN
jgi:zinc protease